MMTYTYKSMNELTRELLASVCRDVDRMRSDDLYFLIGKEVVRLATAPVEAKAKGRKAASDAVKAALCQQEQFKSLIRDALLGRRIPVVDEDYRNIGQLAEFRAMGL